MMDAKKLKYAQIAIAVVVVIGIIVGVGPLFVGTLLKNFVKLSPVHTAAMYAKVTGVVSTDNNNMVVVTSTGGTKYVIEGNQLAEIKKFNGKSLEVFGRMKRAKPAKVTVDGKDVPVRFNVEASKFAQKDLAVGESLSPEALKALNEKAKAKLAFRTEVLKKLGVNKNVTYDVIKGKVHLEGYTDTVTLAKSKVLVLTDQYNDRFNLTGDAILPIIDNMGGFQDATVVLLGTVVPDIRGMYPEPGVLTFGVSGAYFEDLTKIQKVKK